MYATKWNVYFLELALGEDSVKDRKSASWDSSRPFSVPFMGWVINVAELTE